jgi:NAD(P)-dependent dehydrogenase (short-subunit alcohol dehydrogenase family)
MRVPLFASEMTHLPCLNGRVVLIVQRSWLIGTALANSFGSKGAKVVLTKESAAASANLPNLAAAVLDGQSHELGRQLETRGIPFVLYTAHDLSEGKFASATVMKPAPVADVVARVEELLVGGEQSNS